MYGTRERNINHSLSRWDVEIPVWFHV